MMDPRFDEMFAFISSHRRAQRTSPEKWRLIEPSSAARCEISEACRGRGRDQAACRAIFVRLNNTRSVAIPKQERALPKAHSKRRERHHKKNRRLEGSASMLPLVPRAARTLNPQPTRTPSPLFQEGDGGPGLRPSCVRVEWRAWPVFKQP